jgi:hypothetical protein
VGDLKHIGDVLANVVGDLAKEHGVVIPLHCGKHGCVLDRDHEGAHRNKFWSWVDGKEFTPTKISEGGQQHGK